jgi:hypothetical protein
VAGLLKFTFGVSSKAREAQKLGKQWKKRTRAVQRYMAHRLAEQAHEQLLEKIPNGERWAAYRTSLEVAEVEGLGDADAFVVRANPRSRTVRNVDEPDTLLYIRSRPRLRRPKPKVQVLEKYNPWTLQTLPFMPDRSEAQVVSRKVTKREVKRVEKLRIRDQKIWRKELQAVGVKVPVVRPSQRKSAATLPDVAHEAFRLEFGIGQKPEPHWRPTLQKAMRQNVREMQRDPRIRAAMIRPSFTLWKSWGKIKAKNSVRVSEARKYVPFQRKLGIRVSK